jgi:hypothetical protein
VEDFKSRLGHHVNNKGQSFLSISNSESVRDKTVMPETTADGMLILPMPHDHPGQIVTYRINECLA